MRDGGRLLAGIMVCFIAGLCTPPLRAGDEAGPARYDEQTMKQPRLIHKVVPEYPKDAKEEGVQGAVILDAVIGKDGQVRETRVQKGEDARLVEAAQNAVSQWRYEPVLDENGEAMELLFTVTLRFKLDGE